MRPWLRDSWLTISNDMLRQELHQCRDEGRELGDIEAAAETLLAGDIQEDLALQAQAGKLLDRCARTRVSREFPHREPDDRVRIRKARRARPKLPKASLSSDDLRERVLGAWLGRAAGCLLGKPVEGRKRSQIERYLRSQDRWPLNGYFSGAADEALRAEVGFPAADNPCYRENITRMVEDDDTNYTVTGMAIVDRHGLDFRPEHVAQFWLQNIPIFHTYTAERLAYRNLCSLLPPPGPDGAFEGRFSSASFRNPAREFIGAQIRGDFFGYVCPARPEAAAELAWRDACISHVKNGIYGEMWVAAMLAGAYVVRDDVEKVIRIGMGEIPHKSRLHAALSDVLSWRAEGLDYWAAVDRVHQLWSEHDFYGWCHTISNAMLVAVALLWGEMDFGRTVSYAVMPGFDTDCNGATAGSVLGMMLGGGRIPAEWVDPLNDTLETGVAGYYTVRFSDLAARTVELIGRGDAGAEAARP